MAALVQIVDSNTLVIVGNGGKFLRSTNWGGNNYPAGTNSSFMFLSNRLNFHQVATDVDTGGLPLLKVAFADAKHGWVVGAFSIIFYTTDGGASWKLQGTELEQVSGWTH